MARCATGQIPDDHFENEPGALPKNETPLSQAWLDRIAALKKENEAPKRTAS